MAKKNQQANPSFLWIMLNNIYLNFEILKYNKIMLRNIRDISL